MKKNGFISLVLALALTFGACGDSSGNTIQHVSAYFSRSKSGTTYTLTISPPTAKAAWAVMVGYDYNLTISSSSASKVSTGTVSSIANNVFTLKPSFPGAPTFTVTVEDEAIITAVTGTITFDDGTSEPGPGSLASTEGENEGGGGGGSSGGSSGSSNNQGNQGDGHTHNWDAWTTTTSATCKMAGSQTRSCTVCNETETQRIAINPSAHDWETLSGIPATCTKTGRGKRKCLLCGNEETGILSMLGHDDGAWHTTKAANCTETGIRELRCNRCSEVLDNEITNALGHSFGNWKVIIRLDETDSGTETSDCFRCDYKETRTIELIIVGTVLTWVDKSISGHVEIPEDVTAIGEHAFEGCSGITSVTFPSSMTSIGAWAFHTCTDLNSITIPSSVASIGSAAFKGCTSLESITIPNSVVSIGQEAFYGCTALASITIPDSVNLIDQNVFNGCSALASVTFPSSMTSIGYQAFTSCNSLTRLTIPSSVTFIDNFAFSSCTGLTSVTFDGATIGTNNSGFDFNSAFPGDLHIKYLAGGAGTYERLSGSGEWTKQQEEGGSVEQTL